MSSVESVPNGNFRNFPSGFRRLYKQILVISRSCFAEEGNEIHTFFKENARAELRFCSLVLLFCHLLIAVAVMICLRSLKFDSPSFPSI